MIASKPSQLSHKFPVYNVWSWDIITQASTLSQLRTYGTHLEISGGSSSGCFSSIESMEFDPYGFLNCIGTSCFYEQWHSRIVNLTKQNIGQSRYYENRMQKITSKLRLDSPWPSWILFAESWFDKFLPVECGRVSRNHFKGAYSIPCPWSLCVSWPVGDCTPVDQSSYEY